MHPMFVQLYLEADADQDEQDKRRRAARARRLRARAAVRVTAPAANRDRRPRRLVRRVRYPLRDVQMLIAAAVCPHPPLLVPEVTGAHGPGADELSRLRAACREAVAVLLGAALNLLVVVGDAGHTAEYPPAAGGSLRDFGVPFTVGADPVLPLSLTIGKWLLAGVAPGGPPAAWWGIASGAATADCRTWGRSWPRWRRGSRCSPWVTAPAAGSAASPGPRTPAPTATTTN